MDEMEFLRQKRPDTSGPEQGERARARESLVQQASAAEQGHRQRRARWLPSFRHLVNSRQASGHEGANVLPPRGESPAGKEGQPMAAGFRRPRFSVGRVATTGALSVALAGGLIASQTVDFGGGAAGPGSGSGEDRVAVANADVLLEKAAAAGPGHRDAKPDEFGYVETKTKGMGGPGTMMHKREWTSVSGSQPGLLRAKATPASAGMYIPDVKADPGRPKQTAKWQDQQQVAEDDPQDPWQPDLFRPNYGFLKSLPSDPDALAKKVREACASTGNCNQGGFRVITHILMGSVVPEDVRSGLLKAAKQIDGIRMIEDVKFAATGERGVAVTYTKPPKHERTGGRLELVFDPETYEILGSQKSKKLDRDPMPVPEGAKDGGQRLGEGEKQRVESKYSEEPEDKKREQIKRGEVFSSTVIVQKGIVSKVGQRP